MAYTSTGTGSPPSRSGRTGAWFARDGLATLGPDAVALLRTLDDVFTGWALAAGAAEMMFPPLLRAQDLHMLDYFRNFPHLGSTVSRLRADRLDRYEAADEVATVPGHDIEDAGHLLPSAACYGAYLHFAGTRLSEPVLLTTAARCFRNEDHHDGLRRLWGFTMREIICIGPPEAVRRHLDDSHRVITSFATQVGLDLSRCNATDPFFRADGSRARMQVLAPVKEEYAGPDGTAVASANRHRDFFGERCAIGFSDRAASTGCVAFGLERWIHVLAGHFDNDLRAARDAVLRAAGGRR